jgi:hypothetical protein
VGEPLGGPARLRWGEPAGGDQVFPSDESGGRSGGGGGREEQRWRVNALRMEDMR